MLLEKFNFSIARFPTLDQVDWQELKKADVVQIGQMVPGGIYHSEFMIWRGDLSQFGKAEDMIKSKRERKSFCKTIEFFDNLGYTVKTVVMTEALFEEFKTLYDDTTLVRERPVRFDLESQVLGKIRVGQPVYLVGMFAGKGKKEKLVSGLLFSVFNNKVSVSFGAKRKFKIRGGAGGMLEYELARFCLEHGYHDITHGTTTNPAGFYSQAGIFEFKARYGYSAYPMGRWYTTFIKNPKVALSDLVFVSMVDGEIGYTAVSDADEKELQLKYRTREVKALSILTTKQLELQYKHVLSLAQGEEHGS